MRKFNAFRHAFKAPEPPEEAPKQTRQFSAYRTILSKHEAVKERLKDEPVAAIDQKPQS
ncbi:MAG: hypothetical protein J6X30_02285 [Clostridia bacterium]|nr:hypothetical protein [Clostridia bacterium]